jgi:hypothetical protein
MAETEGSNIVLLEEVKFARFKAKVGAMSDPWRRVARKYIRLLEQRRPRKKGKKTK